jgi:hypothetical protein
VEVAAVRRLLRAALAVLPFVLLLGCTYEQRLARYHERWMAALYTAALDGTAPEAPEDAPQEVREVLAPLYGDGGPLALRLHAAREGLRPAQQRLCDAVDALQIAVEARDSASLELHGPELRTALEQQRQARAELSAANAALAAWEQQLAAAWTQVAPDSAVHTELWLHAARYAPESAPNQEGRAEYAAYAAEAAELLAQTYAGTDGGALPRAPKGAERLAADVALLHQSALLRSQLEAAAVRDVRQVEELADVDLSKVKFEDIDMRQGTWAAERVTTARARLRLAGLLLAALQDGATALRADTERRWQADLRDAATPCPLPAVPGRQ